MLGTVLLVVGVIWAFLGAGNIVRMFGDGTLGDGLLLFGVIFNMVLFVLPGLICAGIGQRLRGRVDSGYECQHCRSPIDPRATVCAQCRRDVTPRQPRAPLYPPSAQPPSEVVEINKREPRHPRRWR